MAKFWLDPIPFARNRGFKEHELNRIERLVVKHQQTLIEAGYEHFSP
ncbi:MAG TPA: DUF4160 domain-containing protein [Anaerolineae bacterium]|nr:DUF4160 domain-containing protein [Anaerolineae bacterium]